MKKGGDHKNRHDVKALDAISKGQDFRDCLRRKRWGGKWPFRWHRHDIHITTTLSLTHDTHF